MSLPSKIHTEKHTFPFLEHIILAYDSSGKRGIKNMYNNCWLNAMVQMIRASSLRNLLPPPNESRPSIMNELVQTAANYLRENQSIPMAVNKCLVLISQATEKSMDLTNGVYQDAADGYMGILTKIQEAKEQEGRIFDSMSFKLLIFLRCSKCKQTSCTLDEFFHTS